jgi:hypothetical protein
LFESLTDLATVVGLVGDQITEERCGVRLEAFHLTSRRDRLAEQAFYCLTGSIEHSAELGLGAAFLRFQLLQAF